MRRQEVKEREVREWMKMEDRMKQGSERGKTKMGRNGN